MVSILGSQFFIQNPECWAEEEEDKGVPRVFISPLSLGSGWSRGDGVGLGGGNQWQKGALATAQGGRHTALCWGSPGVLRVPSPCD